MTAPARLGSQTLSIPDGHRLSKDCRQFLDYLQKAVFDSLTDEVSATPKPGLVDLHDSGAHRDMDYHTFEASTYAITPYLVEMAALGLRFHGDPEELFSQIRPVGIRAEQAMFSATGGVNTHKGMIFSMGLTAAAAGAVFAGRSRTDSRPAKMGDEILSYCLAMCRNPLEAEFLRIREKAERNDSRDSNDFQTHGERLFLTYGCRGIRGEAADGFPSIGSCSLPALRELAAQHGLASALPAENVSLWNAVCLQTLLHLMSEVDDTNILYRADYSALAYVREQASRLLSLGGSFSPEGMEGLKLLNLDFIERNLSPGGCADLLAITLFLWRLEQYQASF